MSFGFAKQTATSNYEVCALAVDVWVLVPNVTAHPSTASVPVTALLCVTVPIKELNKCWPRNSNCSSTQLLHEYFRPIYRYLTMNISETVRDA